MPEDPAAEAQRLFLSAAGAAAPALTTIAVEKSLPYLTERYQLHPEFRDAMEREARNAKPPVAVCPRLGVDLSRWWLGVGPFDLSLQWDGRTSVYAELKCGPTNESLDACVWDALKCALVVRIGQAAGAFLVAGAPATLWSAGSPGTELLRDGEWSALDLRERYAPWWKKWEKEGDLPLRVPDRLRTAAVARFEFAVDGAAWVLGVARVEPLGDEWLDWPPFFPETRPRS